jgi:FkbM family methyltransferase
MNFFERFVKKSLQNFGVLIRYYSPSSSEEARRMKLLEHYGISLVLDVGANQGQFAMGLIDAGYKGKIVSFEPLSKAHAILLKQSSKYPNWKVAQRCAIGAENKEVEINISENLVSSTLLDMLDTHLEGAPESRVIGTEKVDLRTLTDAAGPYLDGSKTFLKIDTQGFELEVLKGAAGIFDKITGIELEISIVPLYSGQDWLLENVLQYMRERGFSLKSINPAFTDHSTGKMLQCNGIFFKD